MSAHDETEATGMVIQASPVGDYDKRIVLLTGELGRITAFARGSRRPGNRFMGNTEPFGFGHFRLIRGRDAYTLTDVSISRHFEELRTDYEATVYASYFLEIADYYTRENMEAYEELNLLYASFAALTSGKFDRRLVRAVYEIRSLVVAGEYPGVPNDRPYSDTARYTMDFIRDADIRKLYTFAVSDEVLGEIAHAAGYLIQKATSHQFKSLELL